MIPLVKKDYDSTKIYRKTQKKVRHRLMTHPPKLFYGLSNITGCSAQEHPAWFASNSSYRSSFYFLIGNLYDDTTSSGITQRIRYFFFYTCH